MQVTELIHTTRAGWEHLYRKYRNRDELLLVVIDGRRTSTLRWDILQMDPNCAPKGSLEKTWAAIQEAWLTYLCAPGRESFRKRVRRVSFGLYGSLPVLTEDSKRIADEVRVILQAID